MRFCFCLCMILSILLMQGDTAIPSPSNSYAAAYANAYEVPLRNTAGTQAGASAVAYFSDSGDEKGKYLVDARIDGPTPYLATAAEAGEFEGSLSKTKQVGMDIPDGPDAIKTSASAGVEAAGIGAVDNIEI